MPLKAFQPGTFERHYYIRPLPLGGDGGLFIQQYLHHLNGSLGY